MPTSVDDSQIDSEALAEQCRISQEVQIHDSMDGDEDEDEDGDGDDKDDEDEEDEWEEGSFDQDSKLITSPRVLKRY